MVHKNQIMEHPILGTCIEILNTSEETNGEFFRYLATAKIGALPPPEHFHPSQTETFSILNGGALFKIDGRETMAKRGDMITVLPKVRHTFRQSGNQELKMIVEFRPALRTEYFFETFYAIAQKGKASKTGLPKSFLQFAAMMNEFKGLQTIMGPPTFAQNFVSTVIGQFAKFVGYKGYIPYE